MRPPEQEAELVNALMEQLDALERRHGLAPEKETLSACAEMGIIPSADGEGALAYLDEAGWHRLLHGIATREPGLAWMVAAACRGADRNGVGFAHFAYSAQQKDDGWILESPCGGEEVNRYLHVDGMRTRTLAAASAIPARRAGKRVLTWRIEASVGEALPACATTTPADDRARSATRDLLILRAGALGHAWRAAFNHALERPMFARTLSDFAHIRLRLLQAYAMLAVVDVLSASLCGVPVLDVESAPAWSTLDTMARTLRDELQQIGGGTGYMAETRLGAAVQWLDACDAALAARTLPGGCGGIDKAVFSAARDYLRGGSANESVLPPQARDQLLAVLAP